MVAAGRLGRKSGRGFYDYARAGASRMSALTRRAGVAVRLPRIDLRRDASARSPPSGSRRARRRSTAAASSPQDIRELLAENDVFGLPFAERYGGTGTGTLMLQMAIEEIAKAAPRAR